MEFGALLSSSTLGSSPLCSGSEDKENANQTKLYKRLIKIAYERYSKHLKDLKSLTQRRVCPA